MGQIVCFKQLWQLFLLAWAEMAFVPAVPKYFGQCRPLTAAYFTPAAVNIKCTSANSVFVYRCTPLEIFTFYAIWLLWDTDMKDEIPNAPFMHIFSIAKSACFCSLHLNLNFCQMFSYHPYKQTYTFIPTFMFLYSVLFQKLLSFVSGMLGTYSEIMTLCSFMLSYDCEHFEFLSYI